MKKLELVTGKDNFVIIGYCFWCPGCKMVHKFKVEGDVRWQYNGNIDSPTFHPSLLCTWPPTSNRCHLFLRDGMIQFLNDCTHDLSGKTVPLGEFKWSETENDSQS